MSNKNQQNNEEKQEKIFERPVILIISALIFVAIFLFAEAFNNHSRAIEQYKDFHNKIKMNR
jgi:hypothetical protein